MFVVIKIIFIVLNSVKELQKQKDIKLQTFEVNEFTTCYYFLS